MKLLSFFKEIPQCVLATIAIAIGVVLYINCQLGSDSLSVFLDGINKTFGIPVSLVDQLIIVICFMSAYFLNKEAIGISTIVHTLIIGVCIELAIHIISPIEIYKQSFWIKCIGVIIAQLFYAFGFALLQNCKSGMSTVDALFYGIMKKTKQSYIVVHFVFDAFYFVIGIALGGIVGLGTVFYMLSAGFLTIQIKRLLDKNKPKSEVVIEL